MDKELEIFVEAAEQLEALKVALGEQKNSSDSLRSLTELLSRVVEQIGRVPAGLSLVLTRAEATQRQLVASAAQVEALRDSIPELISRIEQSDVGRSIDALTAEVSTSKEHLQAFHEASRRSQTLVHEFKVAGEVATQKIDAELKATQEIQARTAAEISTMRTELVSRLEQVKAGMDGFSRAADSSAGASANAFSQTTNAIRTSAERQAASMQQVAALLKKLQDDDVSELRQELAKVREQMAIQHKLLEALSKRKGFTF